MMKTFALATTLALGLAGAALAQTQGPSGQQDTNKPGMANPSTSGSMGTGTTTSGTTGTSGMAPTAGSSSPSNGTPTPTPSGKSGTMAPK